MHIWTGLGLCQFAHHIYFYKIFRWWARLYPFTFIVSLTSLAPSKSSRSEVPGDVTCPWAAADRPPPQRISNSFAPSPGRTIMLLDAQTWAYILLMKRGVILCLSASLRSVSWLLIALIGFLRSGSCSTVISGTVAPCSPRLRARLRRGGGGSNGNTPVVRSRSRSQCLCGVGGSTLSRVVAKKRFLMFACRLRGNGLPQMLSFGISGLRSLILILCDSGGW